MEFYSVTDLTWEQHSHTEHSQCCRIKEFPAMPVPWEKEEKELASWASLAVAAKAPAGLCLSSLQ